ncbi:hypothetical protein NC661_12005 [Aquibacillus koreensis]|uniref:PLD phosphodiesterase domain-containing protein n=1 Tax=Aquibacillus koreensis TaxID=279446 RepID=A0A9X3WLM6_9BACI|nr:hypothetical protein [Aquibacillus koreensis]MCT2535234.1 hypothetical protein [Aquibacillus koreensis]MDC3421093.1 hypothetical protein [Aquibacillus koreensis]
MKIVTENVKQQIKKELKNVETSLLIISPYLQGEVIDQLLSIISGKDIELKLVISTPGLDAITGVMDMQALIQLEESGAIIKMMENLETSLFLIDDRYLYVGVLDELVEQNNKGCLFFGEVDKGEIEKINQKYWDNEEMEDFKNYKGVEKGIEQLKENNELLFDQLADLEDKIKSLSNTSKENKSDSSSASDNTKSEQKFIFDDLKTKGIIETYEYVPLDKYEDLYKIDHKHIVKVLSSEGDKESKSFQFQLTEDDAGLFKQREVQSVIILLGEKNEFISLPSMFVTKHMLKRTYKGEGGWEFELTRTEKELFLTVNAKRVKKEIDIKQYKEGLNFRMKGKKV